MVQVINMGQQPESGASKVLGAVGQGLVNVTGVGLQAKLNEMQTQREQQAQRQNNAIQNESIIKAFGMHDLLKEGPVYSEPKSVLQAMMEHQKQIYEYGGEQALNNYRTGKAPNQTQLQGPIQRQSNEKSIPYQDRPAIEEGEQPTFQLQRQSNEKSIPYQDRPAIEEGEQPTFQQSKPSQPQQRNFDAERESERQKYENQIENPAIGSKQRKQIDDIYSKRIEQIDRQEKIAQQKKISEKELQELPKQVSERLTKFEEMATRADQSLNAIENIDTLLAQGAQLPEIVTDINMKLGPENPVSRFVTSLVNNPLAKALETARVQQFTGMKDVFGGQIRLAEFNEFIKKLQDVRDPALSNKIKSVILRQFANMEKFPYQGLEQAKEENRSAPSDVILSKGKRYADQMAKDYVKSSKAELDEILKSTNRNTKTKHQTLPKATLYDGKIATDTKTGKKYKSTNGQWKEM